MKKIIVILAAVLISLSACKKEDEPVSITFDIQYKPNISIAGQYYVNVSSFVVMKNILDTVYIDYLGISKENIILNNNEVFKLSRTITDDDTIAQLQERKFYYYYHISYKTLTDGKIYGYTFALVIIPTHSISFHTGVNKYYFNF